MATTPRSVSVSSWYLPEQSAFSELVRSKSEFRYRVPEMADHQVVHPVVVRELGVSAEDDGGQLAVILAVLLLLALAVVAVIAASCRRSSRHTESSVGPRKAS